MKQSAHHPRRLIDHLHALRLGPTVLMAWDVAGGAPVWVKVLRSPNDSASGVDDDRLLRLEQTLVYEGDLTELRDDATIASAPRYYYTVFARDPEGVWHEQLDVILEPSTETHWARDEELAPGPAADRFAELRAGLQGA